MDVKKIQESLWVNLFEWSLTEGKKEVISEYQRLKQVKSTVVLEHLWVIDKLSKSDQITLSNALIKRFHAMAVNITGKHLTSDEVEIYNYYIATIRTNFLLKAYVANEYSLSYSHLAKPVMIRRFAKEYFSKLFDSPPELLSKNSWVYQAYIDKWDTYIFSEVMSKRAMQFAYSHRLVPSTIDFTAWGGTISILSWLGISSQTTFDLITNQNIDDIFNLIIDLIRYFSSELKGNILKELALNNLSVMFNI